jgi:cytochrome b
MNRILVWDLPTRAFHWLMAFSFAGAYVTSESEKWRDVHVVLGYTMVGLIAFRVLWGLIGTRYARFGSFLYGPRAVVAYAKSLVTVEPQHFVGHNPAGSWAIWLILVLGLATGASGYAVYADVGGELFEELHEVVSNAMLAVVLVHIAGVVFSSILHGENLARSMVTGYKLGPAVDGIRRNHWLLAAGLVATVIAVWVGQA